MKISEQHNLPDIIWTLTFVDTRARARTHAHTHTHTHRALYHFRQLDCTGQNYSSTRHFSPEPNAERVSQQQNQQDMFLKNK